MTVNLNQCNKGIFNFHITQPLNEEDIDFENLVYKVYHFIRSWFQEISYFFSTLTLTIQEKIMGAPSEYVIPSATNNHWKDESQGLYVAIHGVNGRPNIWHPQLNALREKQPHFDIRLPFIPKKGNCSLDESASPIEAMIRDYIRQHPSKPICLLGFSNGARIAAELEIRLRNTQPPIKLSTISGPFAGTKNLDLANKLKVADWIYTPPFIDELLYQSKTATELMKRLKDAFNRAPRSYDFFATPNDSQIRPYTGSFPHLENKDANYFLVTGENHNSIVSRVSELQVQRCVEWMHRFSHR